MYTVSERAAEIQAAEEIGLHHTKAEYHYGEDVGTGKKWVMAEGPSGFSSKYYYT